MTSIQDHGSRGLANVLKVLRTLSQLILHCFQFSTADIAEFVQRVLVSGCPGLHFLGRNVGLRIRMNNELNDPFRARQHVGRGTQAYAAQKCTARAELVRS